ncbi:uncharacterized protein BX663DRAFT_556402 [Cokeromyces recurvatus]|uniref:uncharacterized protein n=1 Tax=Cokeromyces recurvatus TaxID=90255 RepID=UPI002221235A|nr:uncharacterized protein BX663DRAFT_556358 [Cokeromyces recurvatus]XP_051377838.1 uncharacterized protein BX663DRAFT_556402 [Cokeromyces recurvatus]KAI7897802.1 hypothetical protein BX663DRAFT_556358 [Cokeromyces recurvatus]KAI7897853.1 hypothetical protein BX663DRAFT_556402 [Cokeromyces recurvatus]
MHLGVSYGSYRNFTTRTCQTIRDVLRHHKSKLTDPERATNIALALDGKNIVIHKPLPAAYGSMFRNCKNAYSVKLTAVCEASCRFTYLRVGDSGNCF